MILDENGLFNYKKHIVESPFYRKRWDNYSEKINIRNHFNLIHFLLKKYRNWNSNFNKLIKSGNSVITGFIVFLNIIL